MTVRGRPSRFVVYLVCCGSPPAQHASKFVEIGQERGWDVCVIGTPSSAEWLNKDALQQQTGHPVRIDYKSPGDVDLLPPPDGIVVAPATVNTVTKWAAGICDTLALGLVVEAVGKDLPLVAVPFTNWAHAAHPAVGRAVAELRSWNVCVLFGESVLRLHDPGTGTDHLAEFPWHRAADELQHRLELLPSDPTTTGRSFRSIGWEERDGSAQATPIDRPMTWHEYEALGEHTRAEYIDGWLVMSPSPTRQHQRASRKLANALDAVLPEGYEVVLAWSWKPRADEFIPDLIVHPVTDEQVRFTGTPVLAVEVLSGNRAVDLVLKTSKYAAIGLRHYWVIDPRDRVLDAFLLDGGTYRRAARVLDDMPADVDLGVATLTVDLGALLD